MKLKIRHWRVNAFINTPTPPKISSRNGPRMSVRNPPPAMRNAKAVLGEMVVQYAAGFHGEASAAWMYG